MILSPLPLVCGMGGPGAAPGDFCQNASDCERGICLVAGSCVAPCVDDSDCSTAERCASVWARTGPSSLQSLEACVHRVDAPSDVNVEHDAAAAEITGAASGDPVHLSGHAGTMLAVLQTSPDVRPILGQLTTTRSPTVTLFDIFTIDASSPAPLDPVSPGSVPIVALIPNGPRAVVSDLGYDALLFSDTPVAPQPIDVTVLSRSGRGHLLDLDLFYVGGGGFAPGSGGPPPRVQSALAEVGRILGGAGIEIGDVRQHTIVGGLRSRYQVIAMAPDQTYPELESMFTLSAGVNRPSVSIFFVRTIDGALGLSGNVPGPQDVAGTTASGIAIAVDLLHDPSLPPGLDLGRTMAHETSHYLGLFHTSEVNGIILEPLPDTPECRIGEDANGDGNLTPDECVGHGADNLMFWAASGDQLSADQNDVIGHALLLH